MYERGQRQSAVRLVVTRVGVALGVVALCGMGQALWVAHLKERSTYGKQVVAERERDELLARKKELEDKVAYLKTERGSEEVLRKQFELGKEGEGVIVLLDSEVPAPIPRPDSWWKKLLQR